MALNTKGNMQGCPCCGFNLDLSFMQVVLLEVDPPLQRENISTAMTRSRTSPKRMCLRCSYVLEFPADHPNNLWAKDNADRLLRRGPATLVPDEVEEPDLNVSGLDVSELDHVGRVAMAKSLGIHDAHRKPKAELIELIREAQEASESSSETD